MCAIRAYSTGACRNKSCSPCPVTTDAEQQVEGFGSTATAINHRLALQHHHGVPVSRSRRAAHHPQTMPCESNSVQHKDVIHETSSSFRVTTAKDQHQVGAPRDSCMIGPSPGDVPCALGGGPAACAEGEDMHICQTLRVAVDATKDNQGI